MVSEDWTVQWSTAEKRLRGPVLVVCRNEHFVVRDGREKRIL